MRTYSARHGDTGFDTDDVDRLEARIQRWIDAGVPPSSITVTTYARGVVEECCTATVFMALEL